MSIYFLIFHREKWNMITASILSKNMFNLFKMYWWKFFNTLSIFLFNFKRISSNNILIFTKKKILCYNHSQIVFLVHCLNIIFKSKRLKLVFKHKHFPREVSIFPVFIVFCNVLLSFVNILLVMNVQENWFNGEKKKLKLVTFSDRIY